MSVERKSSLWRFDKTVAGVRLQSRAIYTTKREAELAQAEAVSEYLRTGQILTLPPVGLSASETVEELFYRWCRWLRQHRSPRVAYNMERLLLNACSLRPDLADLPAVDLTPRQAEQWAEAIAQDQEARGHGRHYANDFLRHAQTAFNAPWGRRRAERIYPHNPFALVDRFAVRRRAKHVPTQAQVAAIRLAAEGEFRLYLDVLLETGARPGEALALTWFDCRLDDDPPSLVLYTEKTAHGDRVPRRLQISHELAQALRSRRRRNASRTYLFRQAQGNAPHFPVWAEKHLRAILGRLGLEWFSVGCFRHYYATTLAHAGAPLVQIQARLGHSSLRTTERYIRDLVGV